MDLKLSGSEWPKLFFWMLPISLDIKEIVTDIDSTGEKTKKEKRGDTDQESRDMQEALGKNKTSKEKEIFYPLIGSHSLKQECSLLEEIGIVPLLVLYGLIHTCSLSSDTFRSVFLSPAEECGKRLADFSCFVNAFVAGGCATCLVPCIEGIDRDAETSV
jgi:hypothetical protein